jgi:murein DD-endopeptidase MepM/ murein hydrolase activator NlpD
LLDKLKQLVVRLDRLTPHSFRPGRRRRPSFSLDRLRSLPWHQRARIDVIRHRISSRLDGRRRPLLVAGGALVGVLLVTVAANAGSAPGDPPTATGATATGATATGATATGAREYLTALERRSASARTDRSAAVRADRGALPPDADPVDPAAAPEPSGPAATPASPATPGPTPTATAPPDEPSPAPPPPPPPPPDWVHPMPGAATTSCFGWRWGVMHGGVDLASPPGTSIRAVGAGTVTQVGWVYAGYGISVVVDHHDGYYTHYAHAAQADVSVGDWVSPGEQIAREGSTGDSTGPHLHFEVHSGMWNRVEPTAWLANRGIHIGGC